MLDVLAGKNAEKRYEVATSGAFLDRLNTKVTFKSLVQYSQQVKRFRFEILAGILPQDHSKAEGENNLVRAPGGRDRGKCHSHTSMTDHAERRWHWTLASPLYS